MGQHFAPLNGMRVLDLSFYAAGPVATLVLADLGADVVKVEPPGGEPGRRLGVHFPAGWSTFFLTLNRNKRSICVDYRTQEGLALVRRLAEQADVIVENARPGTWKKYGLAYDDLKDINPGLVYGSISGFGETGPMSGWIAMDPIAQAVGGLMSITGSAHCGPAKVGAAIADVTSGRLLAFGVVVALLERAGTGKGRRVTTSLLDTVVSMLTMRETDYAMTGEEPGLLGTAHSQAVPGQAFATKDRRTVLLTLYTDEHFRKWCELVGRQDLADDPRFVSNTSRKENMTECVLAVQNVLAEFTLDELTEMFAGQVPFGPILGFDQLWDHPQLKENGILVKFEHPDVGEVLSIGSPVHFDDHGVTVRHLPPRLGANTVEVLEELGIPRLEIDRLLASGVLHADLGADGIADTGPEDGPSRSVSAGSR